MIDFKSKTVLVTGSSRGIGRAIALRFAAAGATVHVNGTRASIADYDEPLDGLRYHQADLRRSEERIALHRDVGPIDVLVNNFGGSNAVEYTMEGFRASLETNLFSAAEFCFLYRDELAARGGNIVNIGSLSSHLALREVPGYTTGKSGMWGLTRALADKWAPLSIRVNMVAPGLVRTRLTDGYRTNVEREQRLMATVPMRRWAEPDEISGAVLLLASPLANYVTGISVPVDGGLLVR